MHTWTITLNNSIHWNSTNLSVLGSVLNLCSNAFLQYVPKDSTDRQLTICTPEDYGMSFPAPAVLPDRLHSAPQTIILLSAKGEFFCQYMYQLGHELCHVISNYNNYGLPQHTPNNWFIESVCEVASRFTLKEVLNLWTNTPPYFGAVSYVPSIVDYYNNLINKPKLPPGSFITWFKHNEATLRSNPILRDLNNHIADHLEPYFTGENWQSLRYLNIPSPNTTSDLKSYFQNWLLNAPQQYDSFIVKIAGLFEVNLI